MKNPIFTIIIISNFLLVSCSVFLPVKMPDMHTYQINGVDSSNIATCSLINNDSILQIAPMRADSPYDTPKMFYSESQYELNSYSYHKWVSNPNIMLTNSIEEKLLQSCLYSNIVNSDFMTSANYRLNSELITLKQIIPDDVNNPNAKETDKSANVHMVIIVQLVNSLTNQVIKSKTFVEDTTVTANPEGYVAGANQTAQMFLNDLVAWLK